MPSAPPVSAITDDADTLAAQRLQLALGRLARRLRRESAAELTPSQLSVLATVHRHGSITLGDLAECERVAPPTVTRVVDKLVEAGLLERRADPTDRRITLVHTTERAESLVAEVRHKRAEWLMTRVDRLPAAQRRRLLAAVDALELLADIE